MAARVLCRRGRCGVEQPRIPQAVTVSCSPSWNRSLLRVGELAFGDGVTAGEVIAEPDHCRARQIASGHP
uniref:Uncharacterized protein n=1 Tax=Mycolicibacterium sp. CBMA 213 TaxID=1968788 RepID=A0A343VRD8_9MYCO|nr:hypothetical protein B5P44_p00167 [Mycolicibacterium sp. CBMA 213]